ncbi:radical SAM protein [Myxococcota bacterium]|nr:radical SAM protein [Myxococcota bacterium]
MAPITAPVITLEITDQCPLSCRYCYKAAPKERDGVSPGAAEGPPLSFGALLSHLTALARETSAQTIQIAGGEPLTSPLLFDWIQKIRELGLRVTLLTDGGLVTTELARRLKESGVSLVQPTLLAAESILHDSLKGSPSFQRTLQGIQALLAQNIPISLAFVATEKNAPFFRDVVELAFALGIKTVALSRYTSSGDVARDEELTPTVEQIRQCLETAQWANEKLAMRVRVAISLPHCVADGLSLPNVSLGHCAITGDTPGLTLDSCGNLRACAVSSTVLGHLPHESLPLILKRAAHSYFDALKSLPPECRECTRLESCRGGCRESAMKTGGPQSPDPLMQLLQEKNSAT